MTVEENLSFPLTIQKMPKADQKAKIDDVLEIVGLTDKKRLIRKSFRWTAATCGFGKSYYLTSESSTFR